MTSWTARNPFRCQILCLFLRSAGPYSYSPPSPGSGHFEGISCAHLQNWPACLCLYWFQIWPHVIWPTWWRSFIWRIEIYFQNQLIWYRNQSSCIFAPADFHGLSGWSDILSPRNRRYLWSWTLRWHHCSNWSNCGWNLRFLGRRWVACIVLYSHSDFGCWAWPTIWTLARGVFSGLKTHATAPQGRSLWSCCCRSRSSGSARIAQNCRPNSYIRRKWLKMRILWPFVGPLYFHWKVFGAAQFLHLDLQIQFGYSSRRNRFSATFLSWSLYVYFVLIPYFKN